MSGTHERRERTCGGWPLYCIPHIIIISSKEESVDGSEHEGTLGYFVGRFAPWWGLSADPVRCAQNQNSESRVRGAFFKDSAARLWWLRLEACLWWSEEREMIHGSAINRVQKWRSLSGRREVKNRYSVSARLQGVGSPLDSRLTVLLMHPHREGSVVMACCDFRPFYKQGHVLKVEARFLSLTARHSRLVSHGTPLHTPSPYLHHLYAVAPYPAKTIKLETGYWPTQFPEGFNRGEDAQDTRAMIDGDVFKCQRVVLVASETLLCLSLVCAHIFEKLDGIKVKGWVYIQRKKDEILASRREVAMIDPSDFTHHVMDGCDRSDAADSDEGSGRKAESAILSVSDVSDQCVLNDLFPEQKSGAITLQVAVRIARLKHCGASLVFYIRSTLDAARMWGD
eukprot:gene7276-12969_t